MRFQSPLAAEQWDNIRLLLTWGHRPIDVARVYGITRGAIATRNSRDWRLPVKLAQHRGPVCPGCRLRRPNYRGRLCRECYRGRPSDRTLAAPTVRLAHAPGAQGDNALSGERGVAALPQTSAPALLISFVYLEPFLQKRARFVYRDWALDSGAYSASTLGITIDLEQYIETCRELMATDPTLTDIFALDVIGDWRASLRNTERMWRAGVPAIPAFHNGEPEDVLRGLARDYPKIALGGAVGMAAKDEWAAQCFARVWPKKIHGFSFGGEKSLLRFPWHSVDATNWELGPCKFGRWRAFKGAVSVRGSRQNLRAEVEYYLKLEQRMRRRWVKEMAKLASLPPVTPPFLGEPGMETTHEPRVETTPRRSRRKGSR